MKRLLAAVALAVVMVSVFASVAGAVHFRTDNLTWKNENASNVGGQRDTLYKQIKVGATDTTSVIYTNGWALPAATGVSDTVQFASMVVAVDSTSAGSFTATSFTITPQVGNGNGTSWTSLTAITFTDVTANDLMFKFPIYYFPQTTRGTLSIAGLPPPALRFLIVAIGGVVSPARIYLQRYEDEVRR